MMLVVATALAARPPVQPGLDLKTFVVGVFPYDHVLFEDPDCACVEPAAQGLTDLRLKLDERRGRFAIEAHHTATFATADVDLAGQTGVARRAPQLVDGTWNAVDARQMSLAGRVDRLNLQVTVPHVDLTLGRQAISFGRAFFFSPLDLVTPFDPSIVDQEYRPGVDAARTDVWLGTAGQVAAVVAWMGDPGDDLVREHLTATGYAQGTLGLWDLGAFGGLVRADPVLGAVAAGSAGPLGLRSEATVTLVDDPFVRASAGADWMPMPDLYLSAELYLQTLGADGPDDYLTQALDPRYVVGELWLLGQRYAGVSASWKVHPLWTVGTGAIANLGDPSVLLMPSIEGSVSDEVSLTASGFVGLGERPPDWSTSAPAFASEFGSWPSAFFLALKVYA